MDKICKNCRFKNDETCVKFNIKIQENFKACNDFADTSLNESFTQEKIQLND